MLDIQSPDILSMIGLLISSPAGWGVLAIGLVATGLPSSLATYFGVLHMHRAEFQAHAFSGGNGVFKPRNPRDIDDLFRPIERWERRLQTLSAAVGQWPDPKMIHDIVHFTAEISRTCEAMGRLNIAFKSQAHHQDFLARIDECRARALRHYGHAMTVRNRGEVRPLMAAE